MAPSDGRSLAELARDTTREHSVGLTDGRTLGWAEYGAPTGTPLIELHGGGASHLSGLLYHREALDADVRIIAVDRPGAGGSSPSPALAVATFHHDIRALAVKLGLRRFVVLGNSNGGMFAVALAHAMPDLVIGAIPLNPATPVFDDPDAWAMTPLYHGLAALPADEIVAGMQLAVRWFQEDPAQARVEDPLKQFPESTEPEIVDAYFEAVKRTPTEVLEQEVKLVLDDAGWGFDIYDVQPRVEFFTGLTEIGTPFNKLWAERLPNAGLHLTSGGHAGQTAPATRRALMECAVALSQGRRFHPTASLTNA